jgi:DNA-binding CsgD family transcriptional regulator
MPAGKPTRPKEERAVDEFLVAVSNAPAAFFIEGEPGIGKTTLWSAAQQAARARGFLVLAARATAAESVQAYTTLAELLTGIEPATWSDLPAPQRAALDQILSRTRLPGAATDQRAVAAAFLSVVEGLAETRPVLLAVDDVQWLDPSSVHVLAYTARRLSRPVGFLGSVRTEGGGDTAGWFQLHRPDAVYRITLRPLSARALQTVVTQHLGGGISRAKMERIYQISGGNPFYAIELARVFDDSAEKLLPSSLADLVQARLEGLEPDVLDPLLAAACVAVPTVEVVGAAAVADHDRVVELLEVAEHHGIIVIEGNRIRFTHPLLATGVYTKASPQRRRQMHRRLADIVDESELRARHLALATTSGDAETLLPLDDAATTAHARGAPAAAAELLELAIALGGDTPERRIRLASHYFDGGEPGRARTLLETTIAGMPPGQARAEALYMLAVVRFMDDGYLDAVQLIQSALDEDAPGGPPEVAMLTTLSYGLYMSGEPEAAERRAEEAVSRAERLGVPGLLSQALGARATIRFFCGGGIDEPSMQTALRLEDHDTFTPVMLRPSVEHSLMLACTGELDAAYDLMREVEQRCVDKGEEGELVFVDFYVALTRIWRGDFAAAKRVAEDVTELARQLGGGFPAMLSLVLQAWLAVYDGSEDVARLALADAIDASKRSGTAWHEDWSLTALGLLEVSLGNYGAALNALEPLLSRHAPDSTEINAAAYLPDAVEALVEQGRLAEAEPLTQALERNGRRLDRAWMLAVGARCRAMVLAAQGELTGAVTAAQQAMEHHDGLAMPFERARTQLLLGRLQRRHRMKGATTTLRAALAAFEQLGTPLWAGRARALLAGDDATEDALGGLSDAERRVAELAASGMTNRDVSEALFISAKTVEATLARVYRKLGIRSRAELGRTMGKPGT